MIICFGSRVLERKRILTENSAEGQALRERQEVCCWTQPLLLYAWGANRTEILVDYAMPSTLAPDPSPAKLRRDLPILVVCLGGILLVLFHQSFNPKLVLFSNDGPLGSNHAQAHWMVSNFHGFWQDLN